MIKFFLKFLKKPDIKAFDSKQQFILSIIVGTIATIFELSIIVFFTEVVGLYPVYSAPIGNFAYIIINYFGSVRFVFHHRTFDNKTIEFIIFFVLGLIGVVIYTFLMKYFYHLMDDKHYLLACIFAGFGVYIWNFFSRKYILFDKSSFKFFRNRTFHE